MNTAQPRQHSIFSPQILNSPLPNITPSPSLCPHISPQPNNIITPHITPQLIHPISLTFNQNPSYASHNSSPAHSHISCNSNSTHSLYDNSSRTTMKFSLPNTKDIPLLTGKHNWGLWHSAVSSLILCSNLLSHIADNLLPDAAYDPDLWPTYPPVITPDSSQEDHAKFLNWWTWDGIVLLLLFSV